MTLTGPRRRQAEPSRFFLWLSLDCGGLLGSELPRRAQAVMGFGANSGTVERLTYF